MLSRFWKFPHTKLGYWSIGLALTFLFLLFFVRESVQDFMVSTITNPLRRNLMLHYDFFTMLCGLASGIVGGIAIIKQKERSWLVWLALLPTLFILLIFIAEFLYHKGIIG
ncbi:MAG: hypothetical protein UZ14_CFX002003070 [Chloroflexi bacterium OLB14]|nr:MAG: hypothetical protein UZ14_CFX002003070 [Chloroflexi bacterium OLB14]